MGMGNIFAPLLNMFGSAFMPLQKLGGPGLGAMADVNQFNSQHPVNPFSVASIPQAGQNAMGAMNVAGNRFGLNNPNQQNLQKQQLMRMVLSKLGSR